MLLWIPASGQLDDNLKIGILCCSLGQGRGRKITMMLAKFSVDSSDDDDADDFPNVEVKPQKEKNSEMTTQVAVQGNR